ncbi:MAG: ABC transporter permease [Lachnospiraceae bacterium]|nr:ABC transporter permease [Lachnospiraceae bacterium]
MGIKRFILLNKRLYKQATYVILLMMIPIAVLAFSGAAKSGSQLMKIGIYAEDPDSESAKLLINEMASVREEISFTEYSSEDEAVKGVKSAKLDEAWVIPAGIDESFERLAKGKRPKETIRLYAREQGVAHLFMQELLESKAFKVYAPDIFFAYTQDNHGEFGGLDEFKKTFYDKAPGNSIFSYSILDGEKVENENYLLMPVRGLLAILLLVTYLSASIFYMEDTDNGLFIYWHSKFKNLRALGYYGVVMIAPAVLVILALVLAGINVGITAEIVNMALYCLALILFSMIVRMIFNSTKTIGVIMPLIVIVSIVLSPVFVDLTGLRAVERLVPSFYYLMSTYDRHYIPQAAIYCLCEAAVLEVLYRIGRR